MVIKKFRMNFIFVKFAQGCTINLAAKIYSASIAFQKTEYVQSYSL